MEDSGIDSGGGDKLCLTNVVDFTTNSQDLMSYNFTESDDESTSNNNNFIDHMFKGINSSNSKNSSTLLNSNCNINNQNNNKITKSALMMDNNIKSSTSISIDTNPTRESNKSQYQPPNQINKKLKTINSSALATCKTLQRKLELKMERAKQNYHQRHVSGGSGGGVCGGGGGEQSGDKFNTKTHSLTSSSTTSSIIPLNKLKIPGQQQEILPLVEYKSGNSDDDGDCGGRGMYSDDDDDNEISFYPIRQIDNNRFKTKHELSDTFSLQEMTIMEDELSENDNDDDDDDDDDSQTLEFLSPKIRDGSFLDKFINCFCCISKSPI